MIAGGHLVDGGEEVLVAHRERFLLAEVKVLGVVVHQLRRLFSGGLSTRQGNAIECDIPATNTRSGNQI